jgi:stringent starvation protein B
MELTGKEDKKERLLAALDRGMVMIHVDARRPGVRVPENLREEAHLRLNLSYRFDPPDLTVSDWGVRTSLSFSGSRFKVGVPWSALFAIASHATREFWMFPEDLPPELVQDPHAELPEGAPGPVPARAEPRRPSLTAVDGGLTVARDGDDADDEPSDRDEAPERLPQPATLASVPPPEEQGLPPEPPPRPPAGRGHLRIVK